MKTANEIIAEFDGYTLGPGSAVLLEKLRYDKSWDLLLPVVSKVNHLINTSKMIGLDADVYYSMRDWICNVDIEGAQGDLVTIIKWYNQNKQ